MSDISFTVTADLTALLFRIVELRKEIQAKQQELLKYAESELAQIAEDAPKLITLCYSDSLQGRVKDEN